MMAKLVLIVPASIFDPDLVYPDLVLSKTSREMFAVSLKNGKECFFSGRAFYIPDVDILIKLKLIKNFVETFSSEFGKS